MENFYRCDHMLVAQGRKAIKGREEGADSIHTEAQWDMPMGSLETRLLCAGREQIADLIKNIPVISLQGQRTKISATPPGPFLVRTQQEYFISMDFFQYSHWNSFSNFKESKESCSF